MLSVFSRWQCHCPWPPPVKGPICCPWGPARAPQSQVPRDVAVGLWERGPPGVSGGVSVGVPVGASSPALSPPLADEMNDHQNTLSYVLINPPPDTRLELNDIV